MDFTRIRNKLWDFKNNYLVFTFYSENHILSIREHENNLEVLVLKLGD